MSQSGNEAVHWMAKGPLGSGQDEGHCDPGGGE